MLSVRKGLTTSQAAELLGVSVRRVLQFINEGRLPAQRFGKQWLLRRRDVMKFRKKPRTAGYPAHLPRDCGMFT